MTFQPNALPSRSARFLSPGTCSCILGGNASVTRVPRRNGVPSKSARSHLINDLQILTTCSKVESVEVSHRFTSPEGNGLEQSNIMTGGYCHNAPGGLRRRG